MIDVELIIYIYVPSSEPERSRIIIIPAEVGRTLFLTNINYHQPYSVSPARDEAIGCGIKSRASEL